MSQYELESQWIKGALPNVKFRFDNYVRATSGEHKVQTGRVVAVLSIEPTPFYVVEELDGTSFNATQLELERDDLTKDGPNRYPARIHIPDDQTSFTSDHARSR